MCKFTHDCVVRFGGAAGLSSPRVEKHVGSPAKEAHSYPGSHRADVLSIPSAFTCIHGQRAVAGAGLNVGCATGANGGWLVRRRDEALLRTDRWTWRLGKRSEEIAPAAAQRDTRINVLRVDENVFLSTEGEDGQFIFT